VEREVYRRGPISGYSQLHQLRRTIMAITVALSRYGIPMGTGSLTTTSLTSYTGDEPKWIPSRVAVTITEDGLTLGRSYRTKVTASNGAGTITLQDPVPFVAA
jgi:hypothetical protein